MTGIQTRTGGGTLSGPPGSVAALIQARMVHLSAGERRIAEVMLARGQELIYNSVSDVAVESGSALSSVVRCCQSLGFKGFQDLKIALSRVPVATHREPIRQGEPDRRVTINTPG